MNRLIRVLTGVALLLTVVACTPQSKNQTSNLSKPEQLAPNVTIRQGTVEEVLAAGNPSGSKLFERDALEGRKRAEKKPAPVVTSSPRADSASDLAASSSQGWKPTQREIDQWTVKTVQDVRKTSKSDDVYYAYPDPLGREAEALRRLKKGD